MLSCCELNTVRSFTAHLLTVVFDKNVALYKEKIITAFERFFFNVAVCLQIRSVIETLFQILVKVNEMSIEAVPNCNFDAFEIVDGKKFYCLEQNKNL